MNERFFINLIREERHYGGPEEGGWYYSSIELVACELVFDDVEDQKQKFAEKWKEDIAQYNLEIRISNGSPISEKYINEVPHYE